MAFISCYFTGNGCVSLRQYDSRALSADVDILRSKALDNAIASNGILSEIHALWYREPGVGFHIFHAYDSDDKKHPLSILAIMMINRGRIFESSMLLLIGSESGGIESWLFLESNSMWNYVLFGTQGNLSVGLRNDQIRLKCAISSLITLLPDETLLYIYLSSTQVLKSKLNNCELLPRKISGYIADFRAYRLIHLCKRFFFSTKDIIVHLIEIKRMTKGISNF